MVLLQRDFQIHRDQRSYTDFRILVASGACERSTRFTCIYLLASIPTIDHRKCAAAWHLGSAFIYLFFRILKENAERETQYQQMINHLSANVVEGTADINDKFDDMVRRLDNQSA